LIVMSYMRTKRTTAIRWYKGLVPCEIVSTISPMRTVKIKWLDQTHAIVPIRLLFRHPRAEAKWTNQAS
jgi:hypothetical protein